MYSLAALLSFIRLARRKRQEVVTAGTEELLSATSQHTQVFFVLDCIMDEAVRSTAVVSALFQAVRTRLLPKGEELELSRT
jgi:hypothetical protein